MPTFSVITHDHYTIRHSMRPFLWHPPCHVDALRPGPRGVSSCATHTKQMDSKWLCVILGVRRDSSPTRQRGTGPDFL